MKRSLVFLAACLVGVSCFAGVSEATLICNWDFTNNNGHYGSTDTVNMYARIFNGSTEGETIGMTGLPATWSIRWFSSNIPAGYSFNWNNIFSQFYGMVLYPGQSKDFLYATFTPSGGTAPDGFYINTGTSIGLGRYQGSQLVEEVSLRPSSRNFSWNVDGSQNAAPEPATVALAGIGSLAAFAFRVKRRNMGGVKNA